MCFYKQIVFIIILVFNAFYCQNITSRPVIKVGIAAALKTQNSSIGWPNTGGAVPLALQYLRSHGYLQEFDVE